MLQWKHALQLLWEPQQENSSDKNNFNKHTTNLSKTLYHVCEKYLHIFLREKEQHIIKK